MKVLVSRKISGGFFNFFSTVATICPSQIGGNLCYTCETNLPGLGNVSEICIQANTDPKIKHVLENVIPSLIPQMAYNNR